MLDIKDIHNLIILARTGLQSISPTIPSEEAAASWESIRKAEMLVSAFQQKQISEQQQKSSETSVEGTNVSVTDLPVSTDNTDNEGTDND